MCCNNSIAIIVIIVCVMYCLAWKTGSALAAASLSGSRLFAKFIACSKECVSVKSIDDTTGISKVVKRANLYFCKFQYSASLSGSRSSASMKSMMLLDLRRVLGERENGGIITVEIVLFEISNSMKPHPHPRCCYACTGNR